MAQAVRSSWSPQLSGYHDTIVALSSGRPPAAIAVLRVSGKDALTAGAAIAGRLPAPRHAALRTLRDPADGSILDHALVLVFPGPGSVTGEDLVEFHVHGGRAVTAAVEAALRNQPGCRAAEPGEFTRRAFANGRIDLVEAEGLADLLAADTENQRRYAIEAADGHVSRHIERWADRLLSISAQGEAILDFGDEDDVATDEAAISEAAQALAREMAAVLAQPTVDRLHDGPLIVLAGPPNAGKSTTLNALVGRDAAIVSPMPGTTRDRIELSVVRGGQSYRLVDTAGLHDASQDSIELEGIERTRRAMDSADLILWLGDEPPPALIGEYAWLHAQADIAGREQMPPGPIIAYSARTGEGMESVWQLIERRCAAMLPVEGELALNARQRTCLRDAHDALVEAANPDLLIVAEHLRIARGALDRLLGRMGSEEMLDALFGRFCIGK